MSTLKVSKRLYGLVRIRCDEELVRFFGEVNVLHRNFYENEMDKDAVEIIARDAEKLIEKLKFVMLIKYLPEKFIRT